MTNSIIRRTLKFIELPERPEAYSFSKVSSYMKCSTFFKLRYIDRIKVYKDSNSTILGSFIHAALEELYDIPGDDSIQSLEDAFNKTSPEVLKSIGIENPKYFIQLINEYLEDYDHLVYLASAECTGPDCIRTKAGKIAKSPQMTSGWKTKEKELNLAQRKEQINSTFTSFLDAAADLDITECYTTARLLAKEYVTPSEIVSIEEIELPISKWDKESSIMINPIKIEAEEDIYLTAFLDLVCLVEVDRKPEIAILDHKTSKERYTQEIVLHNQQLNIYAVLYELLSGQQVKYIGINSIRHKELVLTEVNRELRDAIMNNFLQTITSTKQGVFVKSFPDSQYSTCLNMYNKKCSYLNICHPTYDELPVVSLT